MIVDTLYLWRTKTLWVALRLYREPMWGKRELGPHRMAYDCGYVSLIIEQWGKHDV